MKILTIIFQIITLALVFIQILFIFNLKICLIKGLLIVFLFNYIIVSVAIVPITGLIIPYSKFCSCTFYIIYFYLIFYIIFYIIYNLFFIITCCCLVILNLSVYTKLLLLLIFVIFIIISVLLIFNLYINITIIISTFFGATLNYILSIIKRNRMKTWKELFEYQYEKTKEKKRELFFICLSALVINLIFTRYNNFEIIKPNFSLLFIIHILTCVLIINLISCFFNKRSFFSIENLKMFFSSIIIFILIRLTGFYIIYPIFKWFNPEKATMKFAGPDSYSTEMVNINKHSWYSVDKGNAELYKSHSRVPFESPVKTPGLDLTFHQERARRLMAITPTNNTNQLSVPVSNANPLNTATSNTNQIMDNNFEYIFTGTGDRPYELVNINVGGYVTPYVNTTYNYLPTNDNIITTTNNNKTPYTNQNICEKNLPIQIAWDIINNDNYSIGKLFITSRSNRGIDLNKFALIKFDLIPSVVFNGDPNYYASRLNLNIEQVRSAMYNYTFATQMQAQGLNTIKTFNLHCLNTVKRNRELFIYYSGPGRTMHLDTSVKQLDKFFDLMNYNIDTLTIDYASLWDKLLDIRDELDSISNLDISNHNYNKLMEDQTINAYKNQYNLTAIRGMERNNPVILMSELYPPVPTLDTLMGREFKRN